MPAAKAALAEWLPKRDAARLLGVSLRQLERREQAGYLEKRIEPRLPTESVGRVLYSRADLEALKAGKPNVHARAVPEDASQPGSMRLDTDHGVSNRKASTALAPAPRRDMFELRMAAYLDALRPAPALQPWLSLDDAVAFSGLPRSYLLAAARDGAPYAIDTASGGARSRWRFNRDALGKVPAP